MNAIKTYIEYLKKNPKGYWFKRKLYGWGWVPVRPQGWGVVIVFIIYIAWIAGGFSLQAETGVMPEEDVLRFFAKIVLSSAALIVLCYWKGEKPRWQWGPTNDTNS